MGIASVVGTVKEAPKLKEPFTDLVPLGNRVCIAEDEAPKFTPGGLEIPDEAQKKPATGTVLALGPEVGYVDSEAPQLKVGCRVVYSKYSGTSIRVKEKRVLLICENDVFAILGDNSFGEVE